MQLMVKDMEVTGADELQDRGIYRVMKYIGKEEGNLISAFNQWIGTYLQQ
jgi:hypothetical protein